MDWDKRLDKYNIRCFQWILCSEPKLKFTYKYIFSYPKLLYIPRAWTLHPNIYHDYLVFAYYHIKKCYSNLVNGTWCTSQTYFPSINFFNEKHASQGSNQHTFLNCRLLLQRLPREGSCWDLTIAGYEKSIQAK
jgi:hypothetical protein